MSAWKRNEKTRLPITWQGLLLACVLMLPAWAFADSMRCGRSVLKTGDSVNTLRSRCGEPHDRQSGYASLRHVNGGKRTRVMRWRYRSGRGSLEKVVLIHEGAVVGIETGSRS